jgi:UDP-GlcNAc:undecaprenyl-phosphate GlcNAc-1-phosphate transferase
MAALDHLVPSIFWILGWRLAFFVALTFLLFRIFRGFGVRAKALDTPSRWMNAKPTIGGLVFYIAFCMAIIPLWLYYPIGTDYLFIFLSGTAAFLLGLWDDLKRIPPATKLAGQGIVALLFVFSSHTTFIFEYSNPPSQLLSALQLICSVFVIVAVMNSINMLDNMDGIATIAVIPILLFASYFDCDEGGVAILFLLGMCGFLIFNWTPAKIYMGDSGSMLLGLVAAWMLLGADSCGEISMRPWSGLSRLMLILGLGALFIVDSIVVVFNRMRNGVSPMKGGRDHTTHNLFYAGMKQWQIAILFLMLGVFQVVLVYFFVENNRAHNGENVFVACAPIFLYFFSLLAFHLALSFRNLRLEKYTYSK